MLFSSLKSSQVINLVIHVVYLLKINVQINSHSHGYLKMCEVKVKEKHVVSVINHLRFLVYLKAKCQFQFHMIFN